MGRAPCCDKTNVKKGPWSPEEDAKLKSYIEKHGTGGNWIALPQKIGLKRCGKSCRLRWLNYLRPNIKHGGFTEDEDRIICSLYVSIGSRWSIIAAQLSGRTDNDIKNYWNTKLKKKFFGRQRKGNKACKKTNGNHMPQDYSSASVINNNGTTTFLPEVPLWTPMLYSNQEPYFSHHASFSNLLSEMHGRFSDNETPIHEMTNILYPFDQTMSSTKQLCHQDSLSDHFASYAHINAINNMGVQAAQPYMYSQNYLGGVDFQALQGESNFPRFELLENLYEAEMVNDNRSGVTVENPGWSEINSLLHNPLTSNCGSSELGMEHESEFNEFKYLGVL